jgi:hypothetical protein
MPEIWNPWRRTKFSHNKQHLPVGTETQVCVNLSKFHSLCLTVSGKTMLVKASALSNVRYKKISGDSSDFKIFDRPVLQKG